MIDDIIFLFNKAGIPKLEFKPAIKIQKGPHDHPVWIDEMFKVRDAYMLKVSTVDDSINMSLSAVDQSYLISLKIRLNSLYSKVKADKIV